MATTGDIAQFLRESAAKKIYPGAAERRKYWLAAIQELLDKIDSLLASSIKEGIVTEYRREEKDFQEEGLGEYRAETVQFVVGDKAVSVRPVGTYIVGAQGRVDMFGPGGSVKFICKWSDPDHPEWLVVVPSVGLLSAPFAQPKSIDEASLLEALKYVLRDLNH